MYFSVNCCDDKVTAQTAAEIAAYAELYPALRSLPLTEYHLGPSIAKVGALWGARVPGPAEFAPVVSDIPTLILAGEFDQNTPAYWGKLAGETLSNSHYLEFPGCGHGIIGGLRPWPWEVGIVVWLRQGRIYVIDGCFLIRRHSLPPFPRVT